MKANYLLGCTIRSIGSGLRIWASDHKNNPFRVKYPLSWGQYSETRWYSLQQLVVSASGSSEVHGICKWSHWGALSSPVWYFHPCLCCVSQLSCSEVPWVSFMRTVLPLYTQRRGPQPCYDLIVPSVWFQQRHKFRGF